MLKRFAIIIESSNVKGQGDLPGAKQDAENWRSFLMSDIGGSWRSDEIVVLNKPLSVTIKLYLQAYADRYVFLAFSGHGYEEYNSYSRKYVTKICLNDSERDVAIDSISPGRLGTAVFDCCRGVENGQGRVKIVNESFSATGRSALSATMDSVERLVANSANYQARTRELIAKVYLQEIEKLTTHAAVRMYSCSREESAGEDPSAGVYYTTLLIQGAKDWAEAQKARQGVSVYNTKQAHDFAVEAMKVVNPGQHPEYSPLWQAYPFAMG